MRKRIRSKKRCYQRCVHICIVYVPPSSFSLRSQGPSANTSATSQVYCLNRIIVVGNSLIIPTKSQQTRILLSESSPYWYKHACTLFFAELTYVLYTCQI